MSLTSYRAAPPRVKGNSAVRRMCRRVFVLRGIFVLCRSGDDLLSRVLRHSTIGAEEFNGRVRDGIGFRLLARITGPAKNKGAGVFCVRRWQATRSVRLVRVWRTWIMRDDQVDRAISTSKLNALPRLHTWPINVVVFHGSDRENSFRGGFPA
jgi:hypothetical protein